MFGRRTYPVDTLHIVVPDTPAGLPRGVQIELGKLSNRETTLGSMWLRVTFQTGVNESRSLIFGGWGRSAKPLQVKYPDLSGN
jgi:hypothetical protein